MTADPPVIREVLNEKNAVFCEPDQLENWRIAIEGLLADEGRRAELGKRAREEIKGYTWLRWAKKIVQGM